MTAFDVHQHLWPEQLRAALAARRQPPRLRGDVLELPLGGSFETDLAAHDLDARLRLLDRDEIDVAVISCPPTLELESEPELVEAYHQGIAELVRAAGGRLRALSSGIALDGFAGACVDARALADLDGLAPLVGELERRGGLLFVHPGPARPPAGAPAWWPAVVDYTAQMQAAYAAWLAGGAERWPDLPVVFAILAGGGPFQLERLRSRGVELRTTLHPSVYFDTASYGRRALELCLATFGIGQLLYGSDAPVVDSGATLQDVRGFGQAIGDALLRENPSRLIA